MMKKFKMSMMNELTSKLSMFGLGQFGMSDCWGTSFSEGPQKHDLTMFSKCNM
jgi:hypothetical protein